MRFAAGTFTPRPGAGRPLRMLAVHARTEFLVTVRNAEQVLLILLIPIALLVGLSTLDLLPVPDGVARVDAMTPRVLALAVMSSAFTGQAIALGFDRRYGVLKRLAATALPRWALVAGRLVALLGVLGAQLAVLAVVALLLGWRPALGGLGWAALLVLLGTLAFGALGVLLGGALRADVVLALANALWFVLLIAGGIVIPADELPSGLADAVRVLPSGALAEGLRASLVDGMTPGWAVIGSLLGCAAVAAGLASRTLRLS
jgi:ABC-2 type transport system permease protein